MLNKYREKMNNLGYYTVKEEYIQPDIKKIKLLEEEIGFKLPDDYKSFLSFYSLSAFEEYVVFPLKDDYPYDEDCYLNVFFGIIPGSAYDLLSNYRNHKGRMASNLLPIANDPGGSLICISVDENDVGYIYFWDIVDEIVVEEEPVDQSNLYLISNSFDDFVNSLEIEQEEDDD